MQEKAQPVYCTCLHVLIQYRENLCNMFVNKKWKLIHEWIKKKSTQTKMIKK